MFSSCFKVLFHWISRFHAIISLYFINLWGKIHHWFCFFRSGPLPSACEANTLTQYGTAAVNAIVLLKYFDYSCLVLTIKESFKRVFNHYQTLYISVIKNWFFNSWLIDWLIDWLDRVLRQFYAAIFQSFVTINFKSQQPVNDFQIV